MPQLAHILQEGAAGDGKVLAIAQVDGCFRKQLLQQPLALDQRDTPQIETVEVKHIEAEIQEVRRLRGKRILKRLKADSTVRIHRHDFAIQPSCFHRQSSGCTNNRRKVVRPLFAIARHHAGLAVGNATQHAVPVEFDLMNPRYANRRHFRQGGQLRLDRRWERGLLRPFDRFESRDT